jgi:putative hydrolase of the HAD superfamily
MSGIEGKMALPDKRPKAILMDLDDTLIAFDSVCEPAWLQCCNEFVSCNPEQFTSEELYKSIVDTRRWYWADPARHKRGRENLKEARREVVRFALEVMRIDNEEWAQEIADRYTGLQDSMISLLPDVKEALCWLRSMNIRLAVITNGASEVQREKLRRFDLESYFEKIFIDTEIGYSKPDPEIFRHALKEMNLTASDTWMVGDNLKWDVMGSQQVGIFAVWNDYRQTGLPRYGEIIPDLIVSSIYEMASLMH